MVAIAVDELGVKEVVEKEIDTVAPKAFGLVVQLLVASTVYLEAALKAGEMV